MAKNPEKSQAGNRRGQPENGSLGDLAHLPPDEVQRLVHELQVHQIELETQNEELLRAYQSLQESRDLYSDLYDFAPVAYLTIDPPSSRIVEANLTAASWLGLPRSRLVGSTLADFAASEDQDILYMHLQPRPAHQRELEDVDIRLVRANGTRFYARLHSVTKQAENRSLIRLALTDVTERKRAELALKEYQSQLEHQVEERTSSLRLANAALQESREQLRLSADLAGIAYWLLNPDLDRMQWGGSFAELIPSLTDGSLAFGEGAVSAFTAFLEVVHPGDRPLLQQAVASLSEGESQSELDFRIVWPDGSARWAAARVQAYRDDQNHLLYVRGVMQDITDRKRVEQAERDHRLLAEALIEIGVDLNSSLDLGDVLDRILRNLRRVVPHDSASILLADDERLRLVPFTGSGMQAFSNQAAKGLFIDDVPDLDAMLAEPDRVIVRSVGKGEYWLKSPGSRRVRSFICAPIIKDDQLLGIVNVESFTPGAFDEMAGSRVRTFVHQAALAIWNAYACLNQQQIALMEERQHMAMELHDAVSQTLWSATVIADKLPDLWSKNHPSAEEKTRMLSRLTRGTLAEMRALLLELRPTALEATPLNQSLQRLVEAVKSRTELDIRLEIKGEDRLPGSARRTFYRIAQEALNNAARHAGTDRIEVSLRCPRHEAHLTVTDRGVGFDASRPPGSSHYGLSIMRERAKAIGAALTIASEPGKGTRVDLRCRVRPAAPESAPKLPGAES